MAEDERGYNATLWVVLGPRAIACFRVRVDGHGRITMTSVVDVNRSPGGEGFDAAVRAKLRELYGDPIRISVVLDGGESFAYFQQEVRAGRSPTPPGSRPASEPQQEGQTSLWDDEISQ